MQCRDELNVCQASPSNKKSELIKVDKFVNDYSIGAEETEFTLGFKAPPAATGNSTNPTNIPADYFCAYEINQERLQQNYYVQINRTNTMAESIYMEIKHDYST